MSRKNISKIKRKTIKDLHVKKFNSYWDNKCFRAAIPLTTLCFVSLFYITPQRQGPYRSISMEFPSSYEQTTDSDVYNNSGKCRPHKNIVFLKTHKCASSSLQNIFMRFGYRKNLTFVLPIKGNYIGHPTPFNHSMVPDAHRFGRQYNILAHHCRFNYPEMQKVMPPDTVFVTILRHPLDLFESMFSFYSLHRFYKERFDSLGKRHKPSFYQRRMGMKLGFNQMLFDLGMDDKLFANFTAVTDYIKFLDSAFDLVMISERMEESLILLRDLLCWSLDDVVVFKLNARNAKFRRPLTTELSRRLTEFNRADYILYKYFLRKFDEKVKVYGLERMETDVLELRNRTNMWYKICVQKEDFQVKVISSKKYYTNRLVMAYVKRKDFVNQTCDYLTSQEPLFTEKLYNRQKHMFPRLPSRYIRRKFRKHRWRYLRK